MLILSSWRILAEPWFRVRRVGGPVHRRFGTFNRRLTATTSTSSSRRRSHGCFTSTSGEFALLREITGRPSRRSPHYRRLSLSRVQVITRTRRIAWKRNPRDRWTFILSFVGRGHWWDESLCGKPEWEEEAAYRRYHKHGTYAHFVVQFSNNISLSKHPYPNLEVAIDSKVAISKGV